MPVLIGPESRIRAAAALAQLDLTPYEIVPTAHSTAAAAQAVAMARAGKVDALMKGALHTACGAEKYLGTPKDSTIKQTVPGGHIGLFMGQRTLTKYWPQISKWIAAR